MRRITREVNIGNIKIGGGNPIAIQSMTNIPAKDVEGTINQINELVNVGCEIVRMAVPNVDCAEIFTIAKQRGITVPLVADIHFDYKIALASLKAGADKIRINPGNIGEKWKVKEVADACKASGVPIRIGVNSGSLGKDLIEKYGSPTPQALAESALREAEVLEDCGFSDIVISIKSSTVQSMVEANEAVANACSYPLHLGVTEAGDEYSGLVKNAAGLGSLITHGIGDTIRVSLTASPKDEITAAKEILKSLGAYKKGYIDVVSCPTCGRTAIDLISIQKEYKKRIENIDTNGKVLKVAVMGCEVNGPGEAKEADFGIAGGKGFALFFRKGEVISKIDGDKIIDVLVDETIKSIGCEDING